MPDRITPPNKNEFMNKINELVTLHKLMEYYKRSERTITKWMKNYQIVIVKGFYSKGLKPGRPNGYKQTQEHINKRTANLKGDNVPFKGKKHTAETKRKMSENSPRLSGDNNPNKKKWDNSDREYKRLFAEKIAARSPQQNGSRNHERGGTPLKGAMMNYRSSWERIIGEILDYNLTIASITYESMAIEFYDYENDQYKHFIPDFIITTISGERALLEIKPVPVRKLQYVKLVSQYEYANMNGMQYLILGEKEIFTYGKIDEIIEQINNGEYHARSFDDCGIT